VEEMESMQNAETRSVYTFFGRKKVFLDVIPRCSMSTRIRLKWILKKLGAWSGLDSSGAGLG
jgi:hypothetical protein